MADQVPEVQIELPVEDVEMEESTAPQGEESASAALNEVSNEAEDAVAVQELDAPVVATQKDMFLNCLKSPMVQLVLGKGEERTVLTAHQSALETSPYFMEKLSHFEGNETRVIDLENEFPDAVACFLQYQYTGEYFPKCMPNGEDLEQDPSVPETDETGEQLLKHARIYTLAGKLGIEKLKTLAFEKICRAKGTAPAEIVYARYVYSNTTPEDVSIRKPIARFWCKRSSLRHKAEAEFRALCLDYPQFGFDVLEMSLAFKEKYDKEREHNSPAPKMAGRKRSRNF